jgi:hypothetical protein
MGIPFTVISGAIVITDPSGDIVAIETKSDGTTKSLSTTAELSGTDPLGAYRKVATKVRTDGLTALVTDATVVVESTFGFDQNPDSFFKIVNTGGAGTTWDLDIAGTSNDPSAPDRDLAAYNKQFIVQPAEVGDEEAFRDRIIQELNQDSVFKNSVYFKAQRATDRAIVHIYSTKFSASGEFYERPFPGDFSVTIGGTPGDGQVVVGFDNVISRSKPVTIARDADSPHRLGLFGITGNVSVVAKELADIFIQNATDDGTPGGDKDLRTTTATALSPEEWSINSEVEKDIFIEQMIFHAQGNGIKFGNFLSQNQPLSDPINVEIKSDNEITTFPDIFTTEDFKNEWAALSGDGANFRIDVQAGADEMLAILTFANPFVIRASGTFTVDDYIKVIIRDNTQQSIARFEFEVKGFEREA